jgi:hypothetical protein
MFSSDKSYFSAVAAEVDRARGGRKAATRLRRIFLCLGYVFFCTLLAIGFGGCGQFVENQFKTRAVYDAPTSGFRIIIDASGSIPPGADITTNGVWKAVVTPLGSTTAKVVTIHSISKTSAAFAVDSQPAATVHLGIIEFEAIVPSGPRGCGLHEPLRCMSPRPQKQSKVRRAVRRLL